MAASAWEILSLKSLEVTLEGGCPEEESSSFQLTVLEEQGSFYLFQKLLANIFPCLVDLNWTICPFGLKMVPGYGTWLFFLNNLVIPGAEMDKSSPDHMADPKERQFSKSNSSKGKYLACRHSAIVRYSGNNTEILALAPKDDADHCSTEKGCLLISGSIEADLTADATFEFGSSIPCRRLLSSESTWAKERIFQQREKVLKCQRCRQKGLVWRTFLPYDSGTIVFWQQNSLFLCRELCKIVLIHFI